MSQRNLGGFIDNNTNTNNSIQFNGSSTYLSLPGAAQYAIATSTTPFTIECWILPTAAGGIVFTEGYTGAGNSISIACSLATSTAVDAAAGLFPAFGWFNGSVWTTAAVSTTAIILNTWSHVAYVFTGSTSKVYVNGIDVTKPSTPTPATTWGVTGVNGDGWIIGKQWSASAQYVTGNISNFRFVNGTAVYTSNFAVPSRLERITNTVLLTCQSNSITDNSSYNAIITNVGSSYVSQRNPFEKNPPYYPSLGAATPGVWTLSQANQAAAQRSWNMYDPYFNLTMGMVHGNGTNGGTNNTFLDSSANNFAVTRNGNTTQGTYGPFNEPAGQWSNYFDGSDYLYVPSDSNLAFGTGDFTIECFFLFNRLVNTAIMIYDGRNNSVNQAVPLIYVGSNFTLQYYVNGLSIISSTASPLSRGVWYHVVVSRVSGNTRMFLNGVQVGSTLVDPTDYITYTNRPFIGTQGYGTGAFYLDGYVSNLRVLKGTGVTSVTVPTAPLQPVPNTQLLTCQNNRFVDNSPNNYAITPVGDVRPLTNTPFYPPRAYVPQNNGGSIYFDGTGDFLTVADDASLELNSSDFCIEMLIYTTAIATDAILITKRASSAAFAPILIWRNAAIVRAALSSNGSSWDIANNIALGTVTPNQWYHISVYRVGTAIYGSFNGTITTLNASTSAALLNNANPYYIGSDSNLSPYVGYISDLRIVIGSSVYSGSSAPIPTAPLTPIPNTQLLLNGTNASMFDNATNLTLETVNATISTSLSKYGGSSMYFNGTNAYVRIRAPSGSTGLANVLPVVGDFTVECWFNLTTIAPATTSVVCLNSNTGSYAGLRLNVYNTGNFVLLVSSDGANWAVNVGSGNGTIAANTWYHVAVVRNGGAFLVYINGVLRINNAFTVTTAIMNGTEHFLGAVNSGGITFLMGGYMSDFRITSVARYQGNFTPPTSTLQNQ